MRALVLWRDSYLIHKIDGDVSPIRPSSPLSDEEEGAKSGDDELLSQPIKRPEEHGVHGTKPPTSSSWVRWWNRSRRRSEKPDLKPSVSAPVGIVPRELWNVNMILESRCQRGQHPLERGSSCGVRTCSAFDTRRTPCGPTSANAHHCRWL